MDKNNVLKSLKTVREQSSKRKFKQTFDLVIATRGLNLKNPEEQVDVFATLHYSKGKPVKICGLVGPELAEQSKSTFEKTLLVDDFEKFAKDKKATKKLANEFDFFVAQGNIMAKVAGAFGRVLGTRGKMPNPKIGCVVPPNANLKPLSEKLHKIIRIKAKTTPVVQVAVGNEEMKDEEVADNVITIYNTLMNALPAHENNIGKIFLKLTMGKPIQLDIRGNIILKEEPKAEEKKNKAGLPKAKEKKEEQKGEEKAKESPDKDKETQKKEAENKKEEKKEEPAESKAEEK